jgi:hypothetical protein
MSKCLENPSEICIISQNVVEIYVGCPLSSMRLEAELIILRCLKLIRGYFHFKKKIKFFKIFLSPSNSFLVETLPIACNSLILN